MADKKEGRPTLRMVIEWNPGTSQAAVKANSEDAPLMYAMLGMAQESIFRRNLEKEQAQQHIVRPKMDDVGISELARKFGG